MPVLIFTSREFKQHIGRAKRAASKELVIVTDRGEPSHILVSIEHYRRLSERQLSLAEALAQTQSGTDRFTPPRVRNLGAKVPDLG